MFVIVLGQFVLFREYRLIWIVLFICIYMFIGIEYNFDDVLIYYKVFRLEGDYGKVGGGGGLGNLQFLVLLRYKIFKKYCYVLDIFCLGNRSYSMICFYQCIM